MSSIGFWGVFLSRIGLDPNLPIDGRMVDWKVGERVRVTEGIDEGRIFIVTSGRMTHDDLPLVTMKATSRMTPAGNRGPRPSRSCGSRRNSYQKTKEKPMSDPDELLSARMIDAEYGIARKTVQSWERTVPPRLVPVMSLPGPTGAHLFKRSDVLAAMAKYKQRSKDEPAEELSELDQLISGL